MVPELSREETTQIIVIKCDKCYNRDIYITGWYHKRGLILKTFNTDHFLFKYIKPIKITLYKPPPLSRNKQKWLLEVWIT